MFSLRCLVKLTPLLYAWPAFVRIAELATVYMCLHLFELRDNKSRQRGISPQCVAQVHFGDRHHMTTAGMWVDKSEVAAERHRNSSDGGTGRTTESTTTTSDDAPAQMLDRFLHGIVGGK